MALSFLVYIINRYYRPTIDSTQINQYNIITVLIKKIISCEPNQINLGSELSNSNVNENF